MKILVDAGHSGKSEPGAVGQSGLTESEVTLAVAKKIKELMSPDYEVILTRDGDIDDDGLSWRGELANGCECFVSLHCNAADAKEAHGSEVWITKEKNPSSLSLADKLRHELSTVTGTDRGIKFNNWTVIDVAEDYCPSCLVEMEFISNTEGEQSLRDRQLDYALAISRGIIKWLS